MLIDYPHVVRNGECLNDAEDIVRKRECELRVATEEFLCVVLDGAEGDTSDVSGVAILLINSICEMLADKFSIYVHRPKIKTDNTTGKISISNSNCAPIEEPVNVSGVMSGDGSWLYRETIALVKTLLLKAKGDFDSVSNISIAIINLTAEYLETQNCFVDKALIHEVNTALKKGD